MSWDSLIPLQSVRKFNTKKIERSQDRKSWQTFGIRNGIENLIDLPGSLDFDLNWMGTVPKQKKTRRKREQMNNKPRKNDG